MATPRYLSGTNAFLPAASGQAIAYVRDPDRFRINRYMQLIRAPKPIIVYAFLDPDQPVRVVTDHEFDWPDGQPRPKPVANVGNFKWEEVRVYRRNYGYVVGEQAVQTAEGWNPKAFFNAIIASMAMTNVTARAVSLIENTANWGSNTASVATLTGVPGMTWEGSSNDESLGNFLMIKKSINRAVSRIRVATNGMVTNKDLMLVISPETADAISETSEVHSYLEKSPAALAQLRGDAPNQNQNYNLPEMLYGLPVVVEDAVRCTIRANADGTVAVIPTEKNYIKNKTSAAIVSRVGGLDGNYGAPSFSTLQRYVYKYEMAIEARHAEWDKCYESAVVDQSKEILAAPQAGYLITGVMAA